MTDTQTRTIIMQIPVYLKNKLYTDEANNDNIDNSCGTWINSLQTYKQQKGNQRQEHITGPGSGTNSRERYESGKQNE